MTALRKFVTAATSSAQTPPMLAPSRKSIRPTLNLSHVSPYMINRRAQEQAVRESLTKHSKLSTKEVAMEAMRIASEICIYTNANFTVEEI